MNFFKCVYASVDISSICGPVPTLVSVFCTALLILDGISYFVYLFGCPLSSLCRVWHGGAGLTDTLKGFAQPAT